MSETKDYGGSAFPLQNSNEPGGLQGDYGMYLRDWFAGRALGSLTTVCANDTLVDGETGAQHIARLAYILADAMIAERAK